jgi:hypothetical protein
MRTLVPFFKAPFLDEEEGSAFPALGVRRLVRLADRQALDGGYGFHRREKDPDVLGVSERIETGVGFLAPGVVAVL